MIKVEARTGYQVLDRAGHQHLACRCLRRHASSDRDGDAGDLVIMKFALPGVEPGTYLEAKVSHPLGDDLGAPNRPRRPVERGKEAIAGGIALLASKPRELAAYEIVVADE